MDVVDVTYGVVESVRGKLGACSNDSDSDNDRSTVLVWSSLA